MKEGNFIVIEGIDGAGTTTQVRLLGEYFSAQNLPVLTTREPTTGPIGALLRQALTHRFVVPGHHGGQPPSWKTMALLFAADRLDHLEAEILPNLREGVTVISDRYDLSSLTYQSATALDRDSEAVNWLRILNSHARRPDLTIVLDVSATVAAQRRKSRAQTAELYEVDALQQRLADAYLHAETLLPGDVILHLDGSREVSVIAEEIAVSVENLRGKQH